MTDAHHRIVETIRALDDEGFSNPSVSDLHIETCIPLRTVQHVVKTSAILGVNSDGGVYLTGEPYTCKTCGGQR